MSHLSTLAGLTAMAMFVSPAVIHAQPVQCYSPKTGELETIELNFYEWEPGS